MNRVPVLNWILLGLLFHVPCRLLGTSLRWDTASVADLQVAMDRGVLSGERLVELSLARIKAYDSALHAVITLNPRALEEARALDAERRTKGPRSLLHGIPIVVKDCINTRDLPTSLGFFGLRQSIPQADARVVQQLRAAGAIILAKVNLSELASGPTMSSAGGQTHNPHNLAYGPGGSSSGTAVAVAAGYAPLGLATDTTGSARWPATTNGVVGFKPTTGLISTEGVMPSEPTLDVLGQVARSVKDIALILDVLTSTTSSSDSHSAETARPSTRYSANLERATLKGMRLGFLRHDLSGNDPAVDAVIEKSIDRLKAEGAIIVDVDLPFPIELVNSLSSVLYQAESRPNLDRYLASLGPGVPHSLAEIYAMSEKVHGPSDLCPYPNPGRLEGYRSQLEGPSLDDPIYLAARDQGRTFLKTALQALLLRHRIEALLYPTSDQRIPKIGESAHRGPKGHFGNIGEIISSLAGWPDLTVPAGFTEDGLPVGLSFCAPMNHDAQVLALGYAFEQATHAIRVPVATPALPAEWIKY